MSNYGEELAYWYLRFNGFFPITNFVLHRVDERTKRSDCDVLAIRMPCVYEAVGGNDWDWDTRLREQLDFTRIIGLICEVKTADVDDVFQMQNVFDCIDRIGFHNDTSQARHCLQNDAVYISDDGYQIAKLLIADKLPPTTSTCLHIPLEHVRQFIIRRVATHSPYKYPDRMFFKSAMLQEMIAANKQ